MKVITILKHNFTRWSLLLFTLLFLAACSSDEGGGDDPTTDSKAVVELRRICESNPEIKHLLTKSIQQAAIVNPDRRYNPAQTLEEFYDFINWNVKCLPWQVVKGMESENPCPSIYDRVDQGVGYLWFLVQQPLDELKDRGYYYPTVEFVEPFSTWLSTYSNCWGDYLSTTASWNDEYYKNVADDPDWGFPQGWYGEGNHWKTFNEFFSRKFTDMNCRPLGDADIVSCIDGWPKGVWQIDDNGDLIHYNTVAMKTACLKSIPDLLGKDNPYAHEFDGGTFTHCFLDVNDYHRIHAPVSGKIVYMGRIPGVSAGGGVTEWDNERKRYYYLNETGFQMVETRACFIIETEQYGLVALLPIGMSQICSINFDEGIQIGSHIEKGQDIAYFMFGGSDTVIMFQKGFNVEYLATPDGEGGYNHINVRENYIRLRKI